MAERHGPVQPAGRAARAQAGRLPADARFGVLAFADPDRGAAGIGGIAVRLLPFAAGAGAWRSPARRA